MPDPGQIRNELDRILSSRQFVAARRISAFLRFVVEAQLEGRADEIKEPSIAISVYQRPSGFDPARDNIVRVEASRLRHKLREYYAEAGAGDPIRIEIPKGSYVPVFEVIEQPAESAHPPAPAAPPVRVARMGIRFALYSAAVIVFALVAINFGQLKARHPDGEALELVQRGRYLWDQRTIDSLKKSIVSYRQAIARAPDFPDAWAGLADSYAVLVANDYPDSGSYVEDCRKAAFRAIELNPQAGRPHAALAASYFYEKDYDTAERENRKAVELSPEDATAHQWYGHLLMFRKRYSEALAELKAAYRLDPLKPMIGVNIGEVYYWSGNLDKALEWYQKVLEIQPTSIAAAIGVQSVLMARHRYPEALENASRFLALFPDDPGLNANRRICREKLAGKPASSS